MNFITINDLNNLINKNLYKIPKDIDLVVGVPRSGLFVANLIALYLNLPLTDFDSFLNKRVYKCGTTKVRSDWIDKIDDNTKILIVEDSSISGNSLNRVKNEISKRNIKNKIIFLTVFVTNETKLLTDIYFDICNPPRMFEWNYLHHKLLENACFDIDGVLCEDPTPEQNDDGKKYKKFIRNAPLKVAPTFKIGYLITSRLEKYRKDTEFWLKKNNIQYGELIMMQFKTKEERIKSGSHGKFKGENYKAIESANIFVESELRQAIEIAKISGKTVFCTENQSAIYIPLEKESMQEKSSISEQRGNKVKSILKIILPKKVIVFCKKILQKEKE